LFKISQQTGWPIMTRDWWSEIWKISSFGNNF